VAKSKFNVERRQILSRAGATAAISLASPFVLRRAWADVPLFVSSYGGSFEQALALDIYPQFTQDTGIKVQSISQSGGNSWFDSLRLSQQSGVAQVDVTMCGWQGAEGWDDVFAPIDTTKILNLSTVPSYLIHKNSHDETTAIAVMAWFSTFITNTNAFPDPPTTWSDAWDPKFAKSMGWNGSIDSSYLIDIVASTFFNGRAQMETDEGLNACMKKAVELNSNVELWYRDEDQFQTKLLSGNLTAGQFYHDVTQTLASEGFPMRSTFPKEGGVIDFGSWVIIKGTQVMSQAEIFIDYCLRPDVQASITRALSTAPVIPKKLTDLTDEEFDKASSEILPIIPYFEIYESRGVWIKQRWQKYLLGIA
jgi:putative spermidine/putrescine transport system substrate-binding protein